MAGDPRKCREHAWRCAELAMTARTLELKLMLIELSKNWAQLAEGLERQYGLQDEPWPPRDNGSAK